MFYVEVRRKIKTLPRRYGETRRDLALPEGEAQGGEW